MAPEANSDSYIDSSPYQTPGVFFEEVSPRKTPEFRTGVPAFLGFAQPNDLTRALDTGKSFHPYVLTRWRQFHELVGDAGQWGFLGHAVRGFFENGGTQCVVVGLPFNQTATQPVGPSSGETAKGLEALESREDIDLICFPDAAWAGEQMLDLQRQILTYCDQVKGRFAILDSNPCAGEIDSPGRPAQTRDLEMIVKHWQGLLPTEGALYFPWIQVKDRSHRWIPPCGHVAGIYARTDLRVGVHKAPANQIMDGVVDLEIQLSDQDQSQLNETGINCLRALPGRGIRVWGARTLSGLPAWRYINVRRLFLTLVRWMNNAFQDLVFEPNTPALWRQVRARVSGFCYSLFEAGALKGFSPAEAFYVKCDAETNPPEEREAGKVILQVGLAPVVPAEFIVVRIAQSAAGTTLVGLTVPD